jgi:hypothetical protein
MSSWSRPRRPSAHPSVGHPSLAISFVLGLRLKPTIGIQTQESTAGIAPKTHARTTDLQATRVTAAQLELIPFLGPLHIGSGCPTRYRAPSYRVPTYSVSAAR